MIDEAVDSELEARLRVAYAEMVPKLLAGPTDDAVSDIGGERLVTLGEPIAPAPRRGLVAAGLLVAAAIVGLVVIAQRDRDQVAPTDSNPVVSTATGDQPEWYRVMRPIIPERFRYAALTTQYPGEVRVVAIDPTDGKALEIEMVRRPPTTSGVLDAAPTTIIDAQGAWTDTVVGWIVQTPGGLNIGVSCDVGIAGFSPTGTPHACQDGGQPFSSAEVRSVASAAAAAFDISVLDADLGAPSTGTFDLQQLIAKAKHFLPDQTYLAITAVGGGDGIVDFGDASALSEPGHLPEISTRIIHGLYPTPAPTGDFLTGSYQDGAAFWMFGNGGVAVRMSTTDGSDATMISLGHLASDLLASDAVLMADAGPVPSTTLVPLVESTISTTYSPVTADQHLLPTVMPAGFDDVADGYTTETEGAQAGPYGQRVRLFAGPGEQPAVVMLFTSPTGDINQGAAAGLTDMSVGSWPSYGFNVVRPSGRRDYLRTGGLTPDQVQATADAIGQINLDDSAPVTLPLGLTEVPWVHDPSKAHDVAWTNASGQQITMSVELWQGVNALANGITWPIDAVDAPIGRIFTSVDATAQSFVQVSLVIDGQAINLEASDVPLDQVVAMAESIVPTADADWARRVPENR